MKSIYTVASVLLTFVSVSASSYQEPPQNILMITDSHGEGYFGTEMLRLLEGDGHHVVIKAAGGSRSVDWNKGLKTDWGYWDYETGIRDVRFMKPTLPTLDSLLGKYDPDTVLVELGTNQMFKPFDAAAAGEILIMAKKIVDSGANCLWVGPPDLRRAPLENFRIHQVYRFLENELPKTGCKLFRSWRVTQYPITGGDGIHYNDQLRTAWGFPIGRPLAERWARYAFWFHFRTPAKDSGTSSSSRSSPRPLSSGRH